MDRRLEDMLRAQRGVYEVQRHGGAVSAQELAAVTGVSGWAVAKVVVVKERDGYAMAVLSACCVLDLDRLKGLIGHGDIRLATVEEVERITRETIARVLRIGPDDFELNVVQVP